MFFFFQAEDGIRDADVTGVQTCALPISMLIAGFAGAWAFLSSPQLEMTAMAAIATTPNLERIMATSGSKRRGIDRLIMRTPHGAVNLPRPRLAEMNRRGPWQQKGPAPAPALCTKRTRLLYRQDVLRERPRFVVGDGPVGRHGNGAPHPGRSLSDLLREISLGVLAGLVFGRHLLVRGANQLLVQGMAAEAGLFLQQLLS